MRNFFKGSETILDLKENRTANEMNNSRFYSGLEKMIKTFKSIIGTFEFGLGVR